MHAYGRLYICSHTIDDTTALTDLSYVCKKKKKGGDMTSLKHIHECIEGCIIYKITASYITV